MSGQRGHGWPSALLSVTVTYLVPTPPAGKRALTEPALGPLGFGTCPLSSTASTDPAYAWTFPRARSGGAGETEAERGCLRSLALPVPGPSLGFWEVGTEGWSSETKSSLARDPTQAYVIRPSARPSIHPANTHGRSLCAESREATGEQVNSLDQGPEGCGTGLRPPALEGARVGRRGGGQLWAGLESARSASGPLAPPRPQAPLAL